MSVPLPRFLVAQIALSLLLFIGAGLFTHSPINLRALHPGFEPERLHGFSMDPSLNGYDLERRFALLDRFQDDIAAEPGVRSVSMAEVALMTNSTSSSTVSVEGCSSRERTKAARSGGAPRHPFGSQSQALAWRSCPGGQLRGCGV